MKTISRKGLTPEQRLAVVRGIVEGTHPTRKILRCIPVLPFRTPPAKPNNRPALVPVTPAPRVRETVAPAVMAEYRASLQGHPFTSTECWVELATLGHRVTRNRVQNTLKAMAERGEIIETARAGGNNIIWQFAPQASTPVAVMQ